MVTQTMPRIDDVTASLPNGQSTWPTQGEWRYEDYLRLPDDGRRYEIIKGILYVANAPNYEHQFASGEIEYYLKRFVKEHDLGHVISVPFEVHLTDETRPVQPDILFLANEQIPALGTQSFDGVPTLIVEIISPSSMRHDRKTKFDLYEQVGVAEYWLVDIKTRSVEVYTLSGGEYALLGQYIGDEQIESNVLVGLYIKTSLLFRT